jgi:hypothetical protein
MSSYYLQNLRFLLNPVPLYVQAAELKLRMLTVRVDEEIEHKFAGSLSNLT